MIKSSKSLEKLGYKENLQHEAEFQIYFKTTEKLTVYLKLENHILYISIYNVHAYLYK